MAGHMGKTSLITLEGVSIAVIFKPEAEEFSTENRGKETNICWDQPGAGHHAKLPLCAFLHHFIHRRKFAKVAWWIFIPVLGMRIQKLREVKQHAQSHRAFKLDLEPPSVWPKKELPFCLAFLNGL